MLLPCTLLACTLSPGLLAARGGAGADSPLNLRKGRIVACAPHEGFSPDAMATQLQVLSLPTAPSPDLSPSGVVHALCSGLKHNHVPSMNDGIRRVFAFTTYECRAALTSRKGYKSGVDKFVEHASLFALPGCLDFSLAGEPSLIPATQTRGALASIRVDVVEQLSFRFASGFERSSAAVDESEGMETQDALLGRERYLFQLAQERRPPLAGCWMVTSIMPAREHMLFNGDAGSVQG